MHQRFAMNDWIMFAGAALLALGVFLPIIQAPIVGGITYMSAGSDGPIILGLAMVIGLLVFVGHRFVGALIGLAIAALLAFSFIKLVGAFYNMSAEANALAKDNPFGGIAVMAAKSVGLGFGWLPLFAGVGMVIGAGFVTPMKFGVLKQVFSPNDDVVELDPDEVIGKYVERKSASESAMNARRGHHEHGQTKTFGRRTR